jgi:hypothetical protein
MIYRKYGGKASLIEKRFGKYGRNLSWIVKIVKRYGHYGKNPSWIVNRYGKYRRKVSRIV